MSRNSLCTHVGEYSPKRCERISTRLDHNEQHGRYTAQDREKQQQLFPIRSFDANEPRVNTASASQQLTMIGRTTHGHNDQALQKHTDRKSVHGKT
jgi:hypothetical protein